MSGRVEQVRTARPVAAAIPAQPSNAQLQWLARARPELAWRYGTDISIARNAHYTNSRMQLAEALQGSFDWLEGDVRLGEGGEPVMRHGGEDPVDLTLATWLQVALTSGRGIKLDVKEHEAIPAVIEAVRSAGVPQHRLIMNVYPGPTELLLAVRRAFPRALINLSPVSDTDLSDRDIVELQVAARLVGGPIMFPLRHDLVTREIVRALRPFGRVAVWNTPELTNPSAWTPLELRLMGVDGMIDLREPRNLRDRFSTALASAGARIFGWNAVYDVLDAVGLL